MSKLEIVYLLVYAVYIFVSILDSSLVSIGSVRTLLNYASIGILGVLFISKTSTYRYVKICIMLGIFIFSALSTDRLYLIIYMMFLMNAKYSNFKKIVKVSFIVTAFSVLFVVLCCKMHIVEDLVYSRDGVENAHSYGFGHYSSISYYSLYLTIMWLYMKKNTIGYPQLAILTLFNYGIYKITTTRLGFYIVLLVLLMYVVIEKNCIINTASKLIVFLSTIGFSATFIVCLTLNYAYDPEKHGPDSILFKIDSALNNRLGLGHEALTNYSPKLFGQKIEMVGIKTAVFGKGNDKYFYIDSGYIYAFLGYGIIFTFIVLVLYTFIIRNSAKNHRNVIFIWAFAVMVFTIANNAWISIIYNPLLFYAVIPEKDDSMQKLLYTLKKRLKISIKI